MMKSLFRRGSKKEKADDQPEEMDALPDHGRSSRKSRKSRSRGSTDAPQDENSVASSAATSLSKSQAQLSQPSQPKSDWGVGAFPGDPKYKGPHRIDEDITEDAPPGPKKAEGQMSAEEKFMAYYQQKQTQKIASMEPAPEPAPVAALSGDHLAEAAAQEDERQQEREQARQEQRKVRENAEQEAKQRRQAMIEAQKAAQMSSPAPASESESEPMAEPVVDADELRKERARQAVEDRKTKAREAVAARKAKALQAAVNKERARQGLSPIDNQVEEDEEAKRKEQKAQEERLEKEKKEEEQKATEKKAQEERLEKEKREEVARKAEEERLFDENQLARELRRDEEFAAVLVEKQKIANQKLEEEHAHVQAVLAEEKRVADGKLEIEQERSQAALEEEKRMAKEQAFAIKALEDLKHQEAANKVKEQAFAIKALEDLKHQEAANYAKIQAEKAKSAPPQDPAGAVFSMEKVAEMMNSAGKPVPAPEGDMDSKSDDDPPQQQQIDPNNPFAASPAAPPQQQQIDPNNPFAALAAEQDIQQSHAAPNAQAPPRPQAQAPPKTLTGPVDGGSQSGESPYEVSLIDGTSQSAEADLSALLDKEVDDSDFLDAVLEDGLGNLGGSQKVGKSSFAKPDNEPKTQSTKSRRAKSDHPSKLVTGLRFFKPKTTGKTNGARTRQSAPPKTKPTPPKPAPKKPAAPPVVVPPPLPRKLASLNYAARPPAIVSPVKPSPLKPASPEKAAPPKVVSPPKPSPLKPASPQKAAPPKVVSPPKPSRPHSTTSRSAPTPILTTPGQPNRDAFAFTPTRTLAAGRSGYTTTTTPGSFAKSPAKSGGYSYMHKSPRHYPTSPARSTFSAMTASADDGVGKLARSPHMPLGADESAGPVCDNPFLAKLHETRGFCQVCIYHLTGSDKMLFEKNGRHLCVNVAYGGCLDCQVFPPEDEDDDPVRLCRKCFFDTHKLHKTKEEAFGGTGSMAGMVSSPRA